jgi:branched-chain amino acid aminotransferase
LTILEGITRKNIIEIAQKLGINLIVRPVDKSELLLADGVFLTGTAAKISSISKIENFELPKYTPMTDKLKEIFKDITLGQNTDFEDWTQEVNW